MHLILVKPQFRHSPARDPSLIMAAPQNSNVLPPITDAGNSIGNSMAVSTAPIMPPLMQPTMGPNPPQMTSGRPARPPPPPLDTMRAYRACLNCRNRKSKCDLDINQGRPVSWEAVLFVELAMLSDETIRSSDYGK